jgi:hypothetical protein
MLITAGIVFVVDTRYSLVCIRVPSLRPAGLASVPKLV